MEKYEIEKLRDLPIEEVADQLGLLVNAHHKAICPFHDDHHASLSFSKKSNTCRCFVCMEHSMDTIALTMKLKHVDFIVATRWLAAQNGIELRGLRRDRYTYMRERKKPKDSRGVSNSRSTTSPENSCNPRDSCSKEDPSPKENPCNPCNPCLKNPPCPPAFDASRYIRFFEHPWLNEAARRFLFEERRIDPRVVSWCRISSWQDKEGTNWLQTPYFDIRGNLVGIQNRNLDYRKKAHTDLTDLTDNSEEVSGEKTEKPRFMFPKGAKCSIYNLPVIGRMRLGDALYITEGCSDCWAMLSAGHKAIAIPSATLLSEEDKQWLQEPTTLHPVAHVPRPRRTGRKPLPTATADSAGHPAPPVASWLQRLRRGVQQGIQALGLADDYFSSKFFHRN